MMGICPGQTEAKNQLLGNGFTKDSQIYVCLDIWNSKKYITYNRKGRPEVYLYFHTVCQID